MQQANMIFVYPQFDVVIERSVIAARLSWPEPEDAMDEISLGGNLSYIDLRRLTWSEAKRVYFDESEYIDRIENSINPKEEYDQIEDELYEDPEGIFGLDIGVASSVVALSAGCCIPFSSCNGGVFGGNHHESHPLIALFARPENVPLLIECAEKTNSGLTLEKKGHLVLYTNDIRNMRDFAFELIARNTAL